MEHKDFFVGPGYNQPGIEPQTSTSILSNEMLDQIEDSMDQDFQSEHHEQQQPLGQQYEYVNHPRHYNNHPSGVEAIIMCEVMEFCPGNAFKYIYRAGEKGNALQDLKKALWYIDREYARLEDLLKLPLYVLRKFQSNVLFTEKHEQYATHIVWTEQSFELKALYTLLFDRVTVKERRSQMTACRVYLEGMITKLQSENGND